MSPIQAAWTDFRDAARAFSAPARRLLLAEFMAWLGHGIFQVLFNLYLVEGHFQEAFVGRAVSLQALGVALAALPAGMLADRWGRGRTLVLGAVLDGLAQVLRASSLNAELLLGASFLAGVGHSLLAIAAVPFLTDHSTPRERTHLFSAHFAAVLAAGVAGAFMGGWIPAALRSFSPEAFSVLGAYRIALLIGGGFVLSAVIPLLRVERDSAVPATVAPTAVTREERGMLARVGLNALFIGMGAGLVIPFMNLYFAHRFDCSSAQIGSFFSAAQLTTAFVALIAPSVARRFGKLRTAVASQLLSLPFLVTLGAERHLSIAVGAFLMRATLMQASTPLLNAFVMEVLPPALRARASSLINLVWNLGWAVTATLAGVVIQRFGYDVPFYVTAALYGIASITFYLGFRRQRDVPERAPRPRDAIDSGSGGGVV